MLGRLCIRHYKVWRTFDRQIWTPSKFIAAAGTLRTSPVRMIRVFGPPDITQEIPGVSGVFDFEDQNFDFFRVHEVKEVKEVTSEAQQRKRMPAKSIRYKPMPLPSFADFWDSTEVIAFKVSASDKADVSSFLRWAREKLELNVDAKALAIERFGPINGPLEYGKEDTVEQNFSFFTLSADSWFDKEKEAKSIQKSKKEKQAKSGSQSKKPVAPAASPAADTVPESLKANIPTS